MSKSKDKPIEKPRRAAAGEKTAINDDVGAWSRTVRETVESVVIAFVLAFLFRTFEAEAFVIPTGSMATTLMGRHMDLKCPKCGFVYQVGAPDDDSTPLGNEHYIICPNCRYRLAASQQSQYYNGDRILVNKFAFDFAEPKRWDVIVFKYPEDAKTNYIKRLIGLPGEVIRIRDGDIGVSHDGGKTFELARKDLAKLRAMLQTVYDNDYVYEPFLAKGWPARWKGDPTWANAKRDGTTPDPKAFAIEGQPTGGNSTAVAWLRYNNYIPTNADWDAFDERRPLNPSPLAEPVTDSIAYDESPPRRGGNQSGREIVSDLAIECEVSVEQAAGKVFLQLSKAGRRFECQLDLATGAVELTIPEQAPGAQPRSSGGISRPGSYRLSFANVDHQLTLSIDNKPVQFDKPTTYDEFAGEKEADYEAAKRQESPVQIGSLGAALRVSHLRVLRDIYYTFVGRTGNEAVCVPASARGKLLDQGTELRPFDQYYFVGQEGIGSAPEDQFFPLGDNSPSSADGRFWQSQHFVDRRLLVGKALFIYWPHSFDKIGSIPFPFFPNFGRMGFVR